MQYSPSAIDQAAKKIWSDKDIYKVENDISKPKHYVLEMFPYPSGAGLHVGHPLGYVASDIYARFKRMKGFNVLHPMGFDSFGLPAEQYAIETGKDPRDTTKENIATYKKQFDKIGLSFDWSREVVTSSPEYYKWTQWLFIEMFNSIYCYENQRAYSVNVLIKHFEEHGNHNNTAFTTNTVNAFSAEEWKNYSEKEKSDILMNYRLIYTSMGEVNWCEALGTVLANDEVINGRSERGNHPVVKKKMRQWSLRMTAYADRLLQGLEEVEFSNSLKDQQRNWIGKSMGATVTFPLSPSKGRGVPRHATANPAAASILYENAKENRKNATEAEKKLWNEIRNRKLEYKFRRQHPIDNYIADFICLEQKLIIEVDGGYHTQTKEYDDARTAVLNELGYRVIRFTNEEVINDIENVLSKLKREFSAPTTLLPKGEGPGLRVFTTRPDTIFGATFMVMAPEHAMVSEIVTDEYKTKVNEYIAYCKSKSDIDRQAEKEVSGQYTGAYAIHPFTGKLLPIYIAEYVLMGYGTGAIMAVPAEDERDRKFAEKFGIEIVEIFDKTGIDKTEIGDKQGILKNSDFINGLNWKDGFDKVIERMEYDEIGERKTQFRLRDANFSRQRYWGEPIPILWKDEIPIPLDPSQLPLLNPDVDSFLPSKDGQAPNARNEKWVHEIEGYTREVDTMPAFAGSSWYFLRYMDPQNDAEFVSKDLVNYWGQVDLYQGGSEHAVGHLLYARYFNHFLYDRGYISHKEPFKRLINQGMIQGVSAIVYRLVVSGAGKKGCHPIEESDYPEIFISHDVILEVEKRNIEKKYTKFWAEIENQKIVKFTFGYNDVLLSSEEDEEFSCFLVSLFKEFKFDYHLFGIDIEPNFDTNIKSNNLKIDFFKNFVRTELKNIDEFSNLLNIRDFKESRDAYKNAYFIYNSSQEFLVGREVEKMSKSKYNVVNPDDVIAKYGADCFRMYEMFLGPIEQSKPWNTAGIEGVSKFLKRFWNLYFDENGNSKLTKNEATVDELKVLHRTIDKLAKDIENFSFNTCVSALMIALNELNAQKTTSEAILIPLLKSICPFAPHTAETIWSQLGNTNSIIVEEFPSVDEKYLVDDTIEYPVSINGKMRAKVSLAADANEAVAKESALSNETVLKWLEGKEVKKFIFVKGRMINVVI
ncbi:MAG: leucine--tRNA ligase [Chitinophagales bacterium]|jgi:leucyl-tRNA synthetase